MQLKALINDDNAVSPVIGVILMVAITVILAAVIGTFVLGLGDQMGDNAPQASFTFDSNPTATGTSGNYDIDITHDGGDTVEAQNLYTRYSGTDKQWTDYSNLGSGSKVKAGTTVTEKDVQPATTIRIVWDNGQGSSATVGKSTTPDN